MLIFSCIFSKNAWVWFLTFVFTIIINLNVLIPKLRNYDKRKRTTNKQHFRCFWCNIIGFFIFVSIFNTEFNFCFRIKRNKWIPDNRIINYSNLVCFTKISSFNRNAPYQNLLNDISFLFKSYCNWNGGYFSFCISL